MRAKFLVGMVVLSVSACGGQQASPVDYLLGTQRDFLALDLHDAATVRSAETGLTSDWQTDRGSSGSVRSLGDQFADRSFRPCRPLQQKASMPDQSFDRAVVACRHGDGTWTILTPDWAPHPKD